MKIPTTLALVFFALHPLSAQDATAPEPTLPIVLDWSAANRGSISIDAKDVKAGRVDNHNFKSDYGSYDKDQIRIRTVGINVRNFSKTPAKVAVETLWFVTPERPPKDRLAQDAVSLGDRDLIADQELKAGQTLTFESSKTAKSNRTRYEALGQSYASGVKFAGWVVIVRSEEKVIAYKASTPSLERLVSTHPRTAFHEMLKDYKPGRP